MRTIGIPETIDDKIVRIYGDLQDITARKAAAREVEFQAELLASIGEAIIATDRTGNIIYWNKAAETIYGWTAEEVIGKPVLEITPSKQSARQARTIMESLLAGKRWSEEFIVQRKDGSEFPVIVTNSPLLDSSGNLQAIIGVSRDITHRKAAKKDLQRSEARFRKIFENGPVGIAIVDKEDSVLDANTVIISLFGYSKEELLERSWSSLIHIDDRGDDSDQAAKLFDHKIDYYSIEKRYVKKDLKTIWARVNVSLLEPESSDPFRLIMLEDITKRKRLETRYQGLFNGIWDAILITDTNREIIDCNPAFTHLFGYSVEDIKGKITRDIYASPDEFEEMGQKLAQHMDDPNFEIIIEYRSKSGGTIRGNTATYYLRDESGEIIGFIGVIRDVTEREKMEQELIASQKMEALGQIAGGIAHDFNNVLAAINGAQQMLNMKIDGQSLQKYVKIIHSSVERGKTVTDRMLTFTRSSKPEVKTVVLKTFLTEFKDMARHTLPQNVHVEVAPVKETYCIEVDKGQIQQVLITLAINASDAMPDGGRIYYSVRKPSAREYQKYGNHPDTSFLCIVVTDEGMGMDEKTQSRIFEPFFTTKESTKGTGLGLAVAQKIIQIHGGWIDVSSRPGQGTTFVVGLPAGDIEEIESVEVDSIIRGQGETLLVVDDEDSVRLMLEEALTSNGYTVLPANCGNDALTQMRSYDGKVDVVITDIGLPDINGKQLIMRLRALYPDIPVIAVTGYVDATQKDTLMGVGANAVFQKPYNIHRINQEIQALLKF